MAKKTDLAANVSVVADTNGGTWQGGRTTLVILAATYPTTCQLQILGMDAATWINVGSNITANSIVAFDAPAGQYRLHLTGGSVSGLYASLVSVPYNV